MPPIRVLIVDDSVVVRKVLAEVLASIPSVEVAGTASNGAVALAKIPQVNPDVITLDIEMPGMDGLQTLAEIRKQYPKLPVVMCSTLTERGASVTLEALARGASDYVTKPSNSENLSAAREQIKLDLGAKILALGTRSVPRSSVLRAPPPVVQGEGQRIDILAIGTSTGGPNALAEMVPGLPGNFPVPVVVVQHMPPVFTRLLAERLNARSPLSVHEAVAGARLEPGHVWVAPGNYHMTVVRKGREVVLDLNQDPPENSCRPAVDVLFRSVAHTYASHSLAVVMTGMGSDGTRGARSIHDAGGQILVQDEATSVVWGMPGSVAGLGLADQIRPLKQIAPEVVRRVTSSIAGVRNPEGRTSIQRETVQ
jgi:two-component system, chemotaxis family, protein-glutamate methylesterase/glutaminase